MQIRPTGEVVDECAGIDRTRDPQRTRKRLAAQREFETLGAGMQVRTATRQARTVVETEGDRPAGRDSAAVGHHPKEV